MMTHHLVTGGAGFVGSHLCEYLLERGDEVTILDDLSTGSIHNVAHLESHSHFHCVIDTVRNEDLVERLIREVDSIFHLAASVGVRLVIERPTEALINNILGTEVILKFACRYRRPVLITSTSEVYGKSNKPSFQEDDDRIMGPTTRSRWGYAASKAVDEFLALAYYAEKNLPVTIVRLFNTVGPRQTGRYGMVIPNFVRQALHNQPITVYGDGTQTRCFAHVCDIVPALVALLENPLARGNVYNLGSQEEISITTLAERIIQLSGSSSQIVYIPYSEAYAEGFEDMMRRVPDISRAQKLVGFQPRYSLDQILKDVIDEQRWKKD